jgi:hypothetical protein
MKRGPKLTSAQRQQLLTCYLEQGYDAAKPLAESLGVHAKYPARLARKNGHTNNYRRKGRAVVRKVKFGRSSLARVIERGPVVA